MSRAQYTGKEQGSVCEHLSLCCLSQAQHSCLIPITHREVSALP